MRTISTSILLFLFLSVNASEPIKRSDLLSEGQSSLTFTENKGQVSDQNHNPRPDVLFYGEVNGMVFHIREDGVSYQLQKLFDGNILESEFENNRISQRRNDSILFYRIDIQWTGKNNSITIETGDAIDGYNNYYLPVCPQGVHEVKSYKWVLLRNVWNGIDMKWYERKGQLEYDFIIAPGADLTQIGWNILGCESIEDVDGILKLHTPLGLVTEDKPIGLQKNSQIVVEREIIGNYIKFNVVNYFESEQLIIDPIVRNWGTYYGGSLNDDGEHMAQDINHIYLSGTSHSYNLGAIATVGAHQTTRNASTCAFLTKFTKGGRRLWGTYYGGTEREEGHGCASDGTNAFLCGMTESSTFIGTTNGHQPNFGGGAQDGFLVKFDANGVRLWGTYYGNTGYDEAYACESDGSNVYLVGQTSSSIGIATNGAHDTIRNGSPAFLVKFNSNGVRLWGTYYGDGGVTTGFGVDVNGSYVYMAGQSGTQNGIATPGAHQTTYRGGFSWEDDGFL